MAANASAQAASAVLTAMPLRDGSNVGKWKEYQGLGWHPMLPTHSSMSILAMQPIASEEKVILFELDQLNGSKMNVWQSLPPQVFIGQSHWNQPSMVEIGQGDAQQAVVVNTAVGTPVKEALALAGMKMDGCIIQLEMDLNAPVVVGDQALADYQALDLWVEWLATEPDTGEVPKIHWMIAVCPYPPDSSGWHRPEVQMRINKMSLLIKVLGKFGGLQAALLLTPFQWQPPFAKLSDDECCGWRRT